MLASVRDESWLVVGNDENECSFRLEDNQLLIKCIVYLCFQRKAILIRDFIQKNDCSWGVRLYASLASLSITIQTDLSTAIV